MQDLFLVCSPAAREEESITILCLTTLQMSVISLPPPSLLFSRLNDPSLSNQVNANSLVFVHGDKTFHAFIHRRPELGEKENKTLFAKIRSGHPTHEISEAIFQTCKVPTSLIAIWWL